MTTPLSIVPSQLAAVTAPSLEQIRRIAGLADPVVRNLQITQAYFELSQAMAALAGPQANWCTFATWASRQAGQSIRQEDLLRAFERLLQSASEAEKSLAVAAHTSAEINGVDSRGLAGVWRGPWPPVRSIWRRSRLRT